VTTLLGSIFLASLLGSVHCAGMCGPLVAITVGGSRVTARGHNPITPSLAYHGGRLASYAMLGAIAGAAGSMLNLAGHLSGLGPIAAVVAGVMLVIVASLQLLRAGGVSLKTSRLPVFLQRGIGRVHQFAMQRGTATRALLLGLVTGVLPCGWLYAFVITAAGTGSAALGATAMLVFWAGTVPALVVVALGAKSVLAVCGKRVTALASVVLIVVGLITILGRANLSSTAMASALTPEATTKVTAKQELPPCCREK
jgi:uncharacterized protein